MHQLSMLGIKCNSVAAGLYKCTVNSEVHNLRECPIYHCRVQVLSVEVANGLHSSKFLTTEDAPAMNAVYTGIKCFKLLVCTVRFLT
jgi:hypothetical protein